MDYSTAPPQLIQHRITLWASNSTSVYTPKGVKARNQADTCILMLKSHNQKGGHLNVHQWMHNDKESSGYWLHNKVNVLNIKLYT